MTPDEAAVDAAAVDAAAVDTAATALLAAFAANDRPRYFSSFVPQATFVFPIVDRVMLGRDDYAAEWQRWIDEDDFAVTECLSSDRHITVLGDVAIFIHRTVTHSTGRAGPRVLHERETIVFHRVAGTWRAAHEHVSPLPD